MGLERSKLPQIPSDKIQEFRDFCEFTSKECELPVVNLLPIQMHINRQKVDKMKASRDVEGNPILISKEGYVLDGHHRWVACKEMNPKATIKCVIFNAPIADLLRVGHEFEGSFTKSVHENATYSELAKLLWIK